MLRQSRQYELELKLVYFIKIHFIYAWWEIIEGNMCLLSILIPVKSLTHYGISNYQSIECLFKVPVNQVFVQPCIHINNKETSETHRGQCYCPFMRGIHQWLVNSPQEGALTWKMFPFDNVIMRSSLSHIMGNIVYISHISHNISCVF